MLGVSSMNAQVPKDKQYHYIGGAIIGGVTHLVIYDVTDSDKFAATFAAVVAVLIAGGLWEHYHADANIGFPGAYIDNKDTYTGALGAISISLTFNIFRGKKKRNQL